MERTNCHSKLQHRQSEGLMPDQDEIEIIAHMTEDGLEFTIVLRATQRLDADQIMVELESYVHELNRAETQKRIAVIQ